MCTDCGIHSHGVGDGLSNFLCILYWDVNLYPQITVFIHVYYMYVFLCWILTCASCLLVYTDWQWDRYMVCYVNLVMGILGVDAIYCLFVYIFDHGSFVCMYFLFCFCVLLFHHCETILVHTYLSRCRWLLISTVFSSILSLYWCFDKFWVVCPVRQPQPMALITNDHALRKINTT